MVSTTLARVLLCTVPAITKVDACLLCLYKLTSLEHTCRYTNADNVTHSFERYMDTQEEKNKKTKKHTHTKPATIN
jgi:hypothetical protein